MRACYDLPAPAKLNLFLHITGRRDDGYHLLESVFILIDWCDTLHIERRSDGRLQRHDLGAALPPDDLCLRAAQALQQASGCTQGADIHIDKQIPWGAGLGGGSSDAATTLLALNRLWGLDWPRQRLAELALSLGADVPFFIGGHNAWASGIGEQLTPIDLPPAYWAVLKPALVIPTRAIFSSPLLASQQFEKRTQVGLAGDWNADIVADFLAAASSYGGCGGSRFGRNDLQDAALAFSRSSSAGSGVQGESSQPIQDDLSWALDLLQRRYGSSRMSGSGSAVFAYAGSVENVETQPTEPPSVSSPAMFKAEELPEGWHARWCAGLKRHPLCGWAAD